MLEVGDAVPDLTVPDDAGAPVSLDGISAGRLVLWFFPKADTPGCTNEATQFRDRYDTFRAKGVEIVGVSRDTVPNQRAFKEKYEVPFHFLADSDSLICDAFGVIVEKTMYGKKSLGIQRSTFLIDGGKITKVWPKVSVEGHADQVLAAL